MTPVNQSTPYREAFAAWEHANSARTASRERVEEAKAAVAAAVHGTREEAARSVELLNEARKEHAACVKHERTALKRVTRGKLVRNLA